MISCAWIWVYIGLGLMLLELVTPGFILCFFGLSAMTVGACKFIFGDAFTSTWQMAAFSAFSILYIVLLRRWLKRVFLGNKQSTKTDFENESVGRIGKVIEPIKPPLAGRIMLGDSAWAAISDQPIDVGADVKVVSQNNLTMKVRAI